MKKRNILGVAAVLGIGMSMAVAVPAGAHTPKDSASCSNVHAEFKDYNGGKPNKVKVIIDDVVKVDTTFTNQYIADFPLTPNYVAHTYQIVVDAWDGNGGTQYDYNSGVKTTNPCERDKPVKPEDSITPYSEGIVDCEASIVNISNWEIVVGTAFDEADWAYKPLPPVRRDLPSTTRELTAEEITACEPPVEECPETDGVCPTPTPTAPPVKECDPNDPDGCGSLATTGIEEDRLIAGSVAGFAALGLGVWALWPWLRRRKKLHRA